MKFAAARHDDPRFSAVSLLDRGAAPPRCHLHVADSTRSKGIDESAVLRFLDLLANRSIIRQLRPRHANLIGRHLEVLKVEVRDGGVMHVLLGARLAQHPFSVPNSDT